MQQIFNFLFKNSNKLLFSLLLGISLILTIQSHSLQRSRIVNSANEITGGVYSKINALTDYLNLKDQNEKLAFENAQLKSILFNKDSVKTIFTDSIIENYTIKVIQSKVIHNSYNVPENYLTINRGKASGIKPYMGVINSRGIIGIIENTSKNYATVTSILNTKSQINAKIKKSNHFGSLIWNAKSTGFVQLIDVPRLASVKAGDTIVTGGTSEIFPENIPIGTINKVYVDNKTNYYTLDVRLFNDMTNIGHVYVIQNPDREEIIELEKETISNE